jgi:Domain of unknown function (DUF2019)
MKKSAIKTAPELVQLLVEKNILWGVALEANKIKRANHLFDQIATTSRELLQLGDSANESILALLTHDDPYVRKWAAFLTLEFSPARGRQVLEQLAAEHTYKDVTDESVADWLFCRDDSEAMAKG